MASPLEQFEIKTIIPIEIGGVDISFTNSSLMMAITVLIGGGVVALAASRGAIVPGSLPVDRGDALRVHRRAYT